MRRRGFTLIEVLLAAALSAVLLILAAQVFRTALTARDRLREVSQEQSAVRRAFETISRDMHSATVPPDDSGLQFGLTAAPAGASNIMQFAAVVGEPMLLNRAANETVLVQYSIAPDPRTNRPTLWRYETSYPVPDGSTPGASQDTRTTPLLPGVTAATYLFYSADQQTWVDSWDGLTGLPTAIRIDLVMEQPNLKSDPRQESWVFTLPAAQFANDEAAASAAADSSTSTSTSTGTASGGAQR
jgi:general secretion pathway protein J